jgi:hypothetical protein
MEILIFLTCGLMRLAAISLIFRSAFSAKEDADHFGDGLY